MTIKPLCQLLILILLASCGSRSDEHDPKNRPPEEKDRNISSNSQTTEKKQILEPRQHTKIPEESVDLHTSESTGDLAYKPAWTRSINLYTNVQEDFQTAGPTELKAQVTSEKAEKKILKFKEVPSYVAFGFLTQDAANKFALKKVDITLTAGFPKVEEWKSAIVLPEGEAVLNIQSMLMPIVQFKDGIYRAQKACIADKDTEACQTDVAQFLSNRLEPGKQVTVSPFPILDVNVFSKLHIGSVIKIYFLKISGSKLISQNPFHIVPSDVVEDSNSIIEFYHYQESWIGGQKLGRRVHPGNNPHVKETFDRALNLYRNKNLGNINSSMSDFVRKFKLADCKINALAVAQTVSAEFNTYKIAHPHLNITFDTYIAYGNRPSSEVIDTVTANHAWNSYVANSRLNFLHFNDTTPQGSEQLELTYNEKTMAWLLDRLDRTGEFSILKKFKKSEYDITFISDVLDPPPANPWYADFEKSKGLQKFANEAVAKMCRSIGTKIGFTLIDHSAHQYGCIFRNEEKRSRVRLRIFYQVFNIGPIGEIMFRRGQGDEESDALWGLDSNHFPNPTLLENRGLYHDYPKQVFTLNWTGKSDLTKFQADPLKIVEEKRDRNQWDAWSWPTTLTVEQAKKTLPIYLAKFRAGQSGNDYLINGLNLGKLTFSNSDGDNGIYYSGGKFGARDYKSEDFGPGRWGPLVKSEDAISHVNFWREHGFQVEPIYDMSVNVFLHAED